VNAEKTELSWNQKVFARDPRMVERKKFGQKKARKRFQFLNVNIQSDLIQILTFIDWFYYSLNEKDAEII
jgi:hypothetical protein